MGLVFFCVVFWVWKPRINSRPPILTFNGQSQTTQQDQNKNDHFDESKFKDFGIEISKIGVKAPVTAKVNGDNKGEYNSSLKNGLAHYKGTALPSERSNIFVFGHSSSDIESGPYSRIFTKLNDVIMGDKITVYYKGKKYEYTVFEKKIVAADDLSPLNLTKIEQLTLMTCWPVGTKDKRLIVIAKP